MPAAYEEILALILAQLSEAVEQHEDDEGSVVITGGDPGEVVVHLSATQVIVAEYAVDWETPDEAVIDPIPTGGVNWTVVSSDGAMRCIKALITAAREARLAKFRTCTRCEERTPPEWMHSDELCQECAEQDLGLIH